MEEDPQGLFQDLFRRVTNRSAQRPYHAFTTAFDQEVEGDRLDEVLGKLNAEDAAMLANGWGRFFADRTLSAATVEAANRIDGASSTKRRSDTIIVLLLEQSGSLRGDKIFHVVKAVEYAQQMLSGLGVKVEILGFGTSTWMGGKSWLEWTRRGRPADPGRLSDLLHIVYRAGDNEQALSDDELRRMLRPDLLKENVDGEALLWAIRRLRRRPESRKILLVISDGGPADHATLGANTPDYLVNHLRQVIADTVSDSDIALATIGVGDDIWPHYPYGALVKDPAALSDEMPALLERLLVAPLSE